VRLPALGRVTVRPDTVFYLFIAVLATAPAWIVQHPPLQDLPFHIATLRLIHDHGNAAYGLAETYRLNLFHTEYILYYLVGDVFAFFLGVKIASVAMMCLYLGGMPLAMRALLRALGKDERLAVLVVPLGVNAMFCMGLLPFVFGFPLMLLGLAAAVKHFEQPTRRSGILLAVLTVLTFFAHVLPFALLGIGCIAVFPWTRLRKWVAAAAPLTVGVLLAGWWVLGSKAGGSALNAVQGPSSATTPFAPPDQAWAQFLQWSTNLFRDNTDEVWMVALALVALAAVGLSAGDRDRSHPLSRGWFLLPGACVVAYLSLGNSIPSPAIGNHGEVWLFGQRFAVPALLTAIPLLRMPRGGRGVAVTLAAVAIVFGSIVNVCKHFIAFEREEVGDLDEALSVMEPRKHVAGLIYDKGSRTMNDLFVPFLHFVSYYQVEKGGVVQFGYAGFPHWPVQYQPGKFPPPGTLPRPRWEWTPEQVPMTELYP
jgi:hypothetical protein